MHGVDSVVVECSTGYVGCSSVTVIMLVEGNSIGITIATSGRCNQDITVGGSISSDVGGGISSDVGGGISSDVGGGISSDVGGGISSDVGGVVSKAFISSESAFGV